MSSVPGPIIRFLIDQPGLSSAVAPAMRQVREQAQSTSRAIADDWKRMTAQLRASFAQEAVPLQNIKALRFEIVNVVDKEIALLRQKDQLTNKELADLKAMTLERERQVNAIKTGSKIGITAGTEQALSQVSTQTVLGIGRALDALVNRYFGGTAGSLFRTARDVSYYSSQTGSAVGGSGGIFSGLKNGLGTLISSVSPTTLVIGAMTAALAGEVTVLASVTKSMIDYAQSVENTAAATGLNVVQVQQYNELAKITGVDAGSLSTAFSRLQVQLGELVTRGNAAGSGNQNLIRVLNELGISAKDSSGKLRPINSIMGDFSVALAQIPDKETRTALAMEAMGTRGKVLAQVMDEASQSGRTLADVLNETSKATLPESEIQQLLREKSAWDQLVISIDAAKIHLEGYIATHAKGIGLLQGNYPLVAGSASILTGVGSYLYNAGAPQTPGVPTAASATALIEEENEKINKGLLDRAAIIKAGGQTQEALLQAEKNYSEAVKDNNGQLAQQYADQIKNLQQVVSLEQDRQREIAKTVELLHSFTNYTSHPNLRSTPYGNQYFNGKSFGVYGPVGAAPNANNPLLGILGGPSLGGPLSGLAGSPAGILEQINKVNDEYFQATASETEKIKKQYDDQLDYWRLIQRQYPEYAQQAANAIYEINKIETQKLADLQDKQFEQYKQKADALFKDLISGNTKSFTKQLESDLEEIVTEPFKKIFENLVGGLLQGIDHSVNGAGTSGASSGGNSSGLWGGILKIFGINIGPGGTAGTFPGSIGLGGHPSSGVVGINSGQTGITTPTVNISAGQVNLGGGQGPSGINLGPILGGNNFLGGGFGSFFGNLNPFGGGSSFFGNLNPFGGSTSAGGSSGGIGGLFGGGLGQILGGLLVGGLGASRGSVTSEAMGAASVAKGIVSALASSGKISAGLAGSLGSGIGGAAMLASGISSGGLGGALEDVAGGASIGTAILPGIGTAIGAIAGAITGGITALFGQNSWSTRVSNAMKNQAIYLPPSETFSFASNGSLASTLQTGFGMSGNTGVTYALPNGTPFNASSIYGPLTNTQKSYLNQWLYGLNPNEPFFGAGLSGSTPANPFNGNIPSWWGGRSFPTSPMPQIHINLPGYVDATSAEAALGPIKETLSRIVASTFNQTSSGMANMARAVTNLP